MILAIDCGNTNTVFALYTVNNQINQLASWRINNDSKRTADLYYPWLLKMFEISKINITCVTGISVASVVPETLVNIKSLIKKYFNVKTLIVNDNILDLGIKVNIDNPKEAGADRLVNSYAAEKLKISPAIIIDFGTATTFDIVSKDGSYNGGIIAPGVNLSLEALYLATANLPKISLKPLIDQDYTIIGKNTINAMESGIFWGYVSMIEGLIEKIKSVDKISDYKVVATGGLSKLFKKSLKSVDVIVDDLTLIGLVNLYLNNKN
ncbi:MAG: pantothenate kinase [Rhodospirillaceae bacterium]|nr:pantothenate kinase [Rhodospirillaceae bacterium]